MVRAKALGRAWANFDRQLIHHHEGEHEIAWLAMAELGVSHEVLDSFDDEHHAMEKALDEARKTMRNLAKTANGSHPAAKALDDLEAATIKHLDHEEAELEPIFRRNTGSEVLKDMGRKMGKSSLPQAGRFFAWVLDGATQDEAEAIRKHVPGPVIAIIGGVFGAPYRMRVAPVWQS